MNCEQARLATEVDAMGRAIVVGCEEVSKRAVFEGTADLRTDVASLREDAHATRARVDATADTVGTLSEKVVDIHDRLGNVIHNCFSEAVDDEEYKEGVEEDEEAGPAAAGGAGEELPTGGTTGGDAGWSGGDEGRPGSWSAQVNSGGTTNEAVEHKHDAEEAAAHTNGGHSDTGLESKNDNIIDAGGATSEVAGTRKLSGSSTTSTKHPFSDPDDDKLTEAAPNTELKAGDAGTDTAAATDDAANEPTSADSTTENTGTVESAVESAVAADETPAATSESDLSNTHLGDPTTPTTDLIEQSSNIESDTMPEPTPTNDAVSTADTTNASQSTAAVAVVNGSSPPETTHQPPESANDDDSSAAALLNHVPPEITTPSPAHRHQLDTSNNDNHALSTLTKTQRSQRARGRWW